MKFMTFLLLLVGFMDCGLCELGRFNAAFLKQTYQSSDYQEGSVIGDSAKAVDAKTGTSFETGDCSHTLSTEDTWWAVDLNDIYTVYSINITDRKYHGKRLLNFTIMGSNSHYHPSNVTRPQICKHQREGLATGTTTSIVCDQPIQVRFLIVNKTMTDPNLQPLILCNFEAIAACKPGTYGDNCLRPCPEFCRHKNSCDIYNGACRNGECQAGHHGLNCSNVCTQGTYGDGCKFKCSQNCNTSCNMFTDTGLCSGGTCKPGYYYGGDCTQACTITHYGNNCTEICPQNCKLDGCAKDTGNCKKSQCKPGYTGVKCTQACPPGYYGNKCSSTCPKNCKNKLCDNTGICGAGCVDGFQGDLCDAGVPKEQSSILVPAAAGGGVAVLVIILIVVLVILILIRRRRSEKRTPNGNLIEDGIDGKGRNSNLAVHLELNGSENKNVLQRANAQKLTIPVVPVKPVMSDIVTEYPVEESEDEDEMEVPSAGPTYSNFAQSQTLVSVNDFGKYVVNRKNKDQPFKVEFENLPNVIYPWDECDTKALVPKNRYKNIYPYNNNRVELIQIENDPTSTYINASYVKDYTEKMSYIAALGATDKTLGDFWRMIWEQNVCLIVMVTNLVEMGKIKCERYWPSTGTGITKYGEITVSLEQELTYDSYALRHFIVAKGSESRQIEHYQYTAWPDKTTPKDLPVIFKIREVMTTYREERKTPILVHCSAGVGRTGTIIALDILLDQAEKEEQVDVFNCVELLRTQRVNMVQTQMQYVFIHDALNEILSVGSTVIPCDNINNLLSSEDGKMTLEKQFQLLRSISPGFDGSYTQLGKLNRDKNRDINVLPCDNLRVKIPSSPEAYINAVYVETYKKSKFIATQVPLANTAENFWNMVYELRSEKIICLQNDTKYTKWFSTKKSSITFDQLTVTTTDISETGHITRYNITVGKTSVAEYANIQSEVVADTNMVHVILLQVKDWPSGSADKREASLIVKTVREFLHEIGTTNFSTVICRNGADECGLYIAFLWLLHIAAERQEVDIYHVVKQIKITRPQFIPSLDQYILLHKMVAFSSGRKRNH